MYKRVLLKISGEALLGDQSYGVDKKVLEFICSEIKELQSIGYEIGIVIGAGNIFRGAQNHETVRMSRTKADQIGMLATMMNAIHFGSGLKYLDVSNKIMSVPGVPGMFDSYSTDEAISCLSNGSVVIFAGGTGNPFFTTDTAAVLRGAEIGADVIVKCTKVDGVFSKDPMIDRDAELIREIKYGEILSQRLKIMDLTALTLGEECEIPILVCSVKNKSAILNALNGTGIFTIIKR